MPLYFITVCPGNTKYNELASIIHIADVLAIKGGFAGGSTEACQLDTKALQTCHIKTNELVQLMYQIKEAVEKIEEDLL